MARKIILLSDGTGNSASKVWRTNVWRTFESLDLSNSDQVAFYDDGVGTSSFKPLAIIGGAFGYGLKRNVIDLYKFVCRNYRSASDYPLRRSFDRPWGSVIARFGPTGNEESFMDPAPVRNPPESLGEVMTPKKDGQLFFYLNLPVIGIWGLEPVVANWLSNEGEAHITVRRTR